MGDGNQMESRARAGPKCRYTNRCMVVFMGRTNIEIDDELVSEAMRRYGLHSKRAAVDLALRRLVGESMTREDALAMEGAGWEGDLDEMRSDHRLAG
jgi:Arc/MetJ family transcription regulator